MNGFGCTFLRCIIGSETMKKHFREYDILFTNFGSTFCILLLTLPCQFSFLMEDKIYMKVMFKLKWKVNEKNTDLNKWNVKLNVKLNSTAIRWPSSSCIFINTSWFILCVFFQIYYIIGCGTFASKYDKVKGIWVKEKVCKSSKKRDCSGRLRQIKT